jgi:exosome complex RNA-binding protein Rrp42 (RNase PH superfamily)
VDPSLKEELTCDGTMTVTLNQHDEVRVRPA